MQKNRYIIPTYLSVIGRHICPKRNNYVRNYIKISKFQVGLTFLTSQITLITLMLVTVTYIVLSMMWI